MNRSVANSGRNDSLGFAVRFGASIILIKRNATESLGADGVRSEGQGGELFGQRGERYRTGATQRFSGLFRLEIFRVPQGGQKFGGAQGAEPHGSHAQIFFSASGLLINFIEFNLIKALVGQAFREGGKSISQHYFSRPDVR